MDLKKVAKASALVTLCLLPIIPLAVPYVFTAGSPIRSTEMNANFQALEALISSLGGVAPIDLVRVTANTVVNNGVPVLTVPNVAARPYVLRQTFSSIGSSGSYASCRLTTAGNSFVLPLMGGAVVGLEIPFAPGDSVAVDCGANPSSLWSFVFSK